MAPLRVGHKGAAHIAPGNTIASFEAARAAGVDMIEFDVLSEYPGGHGQLLIGHDYHDIRTRSPISLDEALAHLAGEAYAGISLDVDVKLPGYGPQVASALREHGLLERSLVCSMFPEDLDVIRTVEPELRLGWSVPRVKRDYTTDKLTLLPALAVLQAFRLRMPARARAALRAGRVDAIMAHWRVVTPALAATVAGAGGELYVWTVDDPALVRTLSALHVAGIITNDPRIFDEAWARGREGDPATPLPDAASRGGR
jgi:glycerophosphoryl diester phosphodiesterase